MADPTHVLVASGSTQHPQLEINVNIDACLTNYLDTPKRMAAALSVAGYFNFNLYSVNGSDFKLTANFTVSQPDPVTTVREF